MAAEPGDATLPRERQDRIWDRLRRHYFKGVLSNRVEQAQREHRLILNALKTRDLANLQDLVRQHNQGALQAYLAYLDAQPTE